MAVGSSRGALGVRKAVLLLILLEFRTRRLRLFSLRPVCAGHEMGRICVAACGHKDTGYSCIEKQAQPPLQRLNMGGEMTTLAGRRREQAQAGAAVSKAPNDTFLVLWRPPPPPWWPPPPQPWRPPPRTPRGRHGGGGQREPSLGGDRAREARGRVHSQSELMIQRAQKFVGRPAYGRFLLWRMCASLR